MRQTIANSGRFSAIGAAAQTEITQSRRSIPIVRQKRRNDRPSPGAGLFFNHTQMFEISRKATGL
jgi:hypothetical protein